MKYRSQIIDACLRNAAARWRWMRFTEAVFKLAIAVCLTLLGIGLIIAVGWLTNRTAATTAFVLLGLASFMVLLILTVHALTTKIEADKLASTIERVNPVLLDRLNTLVFLEGAGRSTRLGGFAKRIARQTQKILTELNSTPPFPALRVLTHFFLCLAALVATVWFYGKFSPLENLKRAESAQETRHAETQKLPELALPSTNNIEQQQAWGEVRVTEPGSDLVVTKADIVPLLIEAAANEPLKQVTWQLAVNGEDEHTNQLPSPTEPRYAVYQPALDLNELKLSDWDVVTYYAKASTDSQKSYASQPYFLEVRPFREDLRKMPGSEDGKAYQYLNELTGLIAEQQDIIRETHRATQNLQSNGNPHDKNRDKLAAAEADLSNSARHLYARLATETENRPITEALESLAKAETSLAQSGKLLLDDAMTEAQNRERKALAELASARKLVQTAISENPKDFDQSNTAENSANVDDEQKLKQMAEFRNETKAAQEFVEKALAKQQQLATKAGYCQPAEFPALATDEDALRQSLQEFGQQHPQSFKTTTAETREAQEAIKRASSSLERRTAQARSDPKEAVKQLQKLDEAMKNQSGERQLEDAYKLKKILDRQIQTFGRCEQSGGGMGDKELQSAASAAKQTVDALAQAANQTPTAEAFGQPLRDALAPAKKSEMNDALEQLSQKQDESKKRELAGQARRVLSPVSKAFEESQPQASQKAQKQDSLQPGSQECFALGLAELQSLIKRLEKGRDVPRVPRQEQAKQAREALLNLQRAADELYGGNDRATKLLQQLEKELNPREQKVDIEALRRLAAELQRFSIETADTAAKKNMPAEVTNIDPERLPPAYRGRIERYFKKLSEK